MTLSLPPLQQIHTTPTLSPTHSILHSFPSCTLNLPTLQLLQPTTTLQITPTHLTIKPLSIPLERIVCHAVANSGLYLQVQGSCIRDEQGSVIWRVAKTQAKEGDEQNSIDNADDDEEEEEDFIEMEIQVKAGNETDAAKITAIYEALSECIELVPITPSANDDQPMALPWWEKKDLITLDNLDGHMDLSEAVEEEGITMEPEPEK